MIFKKELPGHYAETANPEAYLINTYNKAVQYLTSSDVSYQIAVAYRFTLFNPWPGRAGEYNQKVMSAILSKAWQFNTFAPSICLREISEFTAIQRLPTISVVLNRLQGDKLIKTIGTAPSETSQFNIESYIENINNCNITHTDNIEYPVSTVPVIESQPYYASEIWSRNKDMLGGSAKMVYTHLSNVPINIAQLVTLTGKCRNTVYSALKKLCKYNLALKEKDGWTVGKNSVKSVAEGLDAKTSFTRRLEKHRMEREYFQLRGCKKGWVFQWG
jgi:hypothetical protein